MYFYHYCTVSRSQSVSVNVKQKENSRLTAAIDAIEVYTNFFWYGSQTETRDG